VDSAGLPLSVASVNGVAIANTTTIIGADGTLVISPNGAFTYAINPSATNVAGLSGNNVLTDAFAFTISDGQTYTTQTTQVQQNLISQSEAFNTSPWVTFKNAGTLPIISANVGAGPTGGASTADNITLSSAGSGVYTPTNVSGQYTFSVWVKLVSGSGSFSLNYYSASAGSSSSLAVVATGTWQRVSLTFTGDGNANSNVALMLTAAQTAAGTLEFWGAQLNAGATPGTYVATTGSTINTTATVTTPITVGATLAVDVTANAVVPIAAPDTASVTEDGTLVATGNVLANDTGPAGDPLSVTAVNGVTITNTTTIVGTYGTLVIAPSGDYTYTLANSQGNVRGLANGQVVTDAFAYTLSDGQTYTTQTRQVQQNLISQSEAFNSSPWVTFKNTGTLPSITANVAPGPSGGASTADNITLSSAGSGVYTPTNVSGQYTFSVWVKLISGSGTFSLNYYSGSANASMSQAVVATSTWQRVSLTFTGDGNANSNVALMLTSGQTAAGTLEFWGAQLNAGATPGTYVATTGSTINTTATVTTPITIGSTLDINVGGFVPTADPDTASVTEDGTLVATGNVLANDTGPAGDPLSVTAVNGVTITNTTTIVGTYGTLVIAPSGDYTYTLANSQGNVRGLANGQVVTDAFVYTLSDGQTYTTQTTQVQQNLISQSEAFNSSPWVTFKNTGTLPSITANVAPGPSGGASTADNITLSSAGSGVYTPTNVSGQYTFSVWVKLISGSGTFSLNYYSGSANASMSQAVVATSTWQRVSLTFTGDGNANSNVALMLTSGQTAAGTLEFWGAQLNAGATPGTYVATTGSTINTTTTITTPITLGSTLGISVLGDGIVPVATPDTATTSEDGTLVATGNVLANDTGPAGDPLSVISINGGTITNSATVAGTYGTLVISPSGTYTYTLADSQPTVRSLANGQTVSDIFTYGLSDGLPFIQTSTITQQNFLAQSEAFDSTAWTVLNPTGAPPIVVQPNIAAGPNGGAATADQINLPGPGAQIAATTNVSGTCTFSIWVRLVSGSGGVALEYQSSSTNTPTIQTFIATSSWQRFTLTFNGDGAAASFVALLHTLYQSSASVLQLWGAQINTGTTASAYVATTGSIVNTTTAVTTNAPTTTLSVNVTGATPIAVADTAAVAVQGIQTATGNMLANDTATAGTTLSLLSVDGISISGTTTIAGLYGVLTVQSDGTYTYTLNPASPLTQTLVGGQVEDDAFSYVLSNGLTYDSSSISVAENLIAQSEAFDNAVWIKFGSSGLPAVVANTDPGPQGGAATADQVTLSSANSGIFYATTAPGVYTFSVWVRLISGNGNFSFNYYEGSANVSYTQAAVATSSWQKFTWTFTGDGSVNSNLALMHSTSQSTSGTFEFWGAELNAGSSADVYISTSGSIASATETITTAATIGATLDVAVSGSDTGHSGSGLILQGTTSGAVVNLATGQMTTPLTILPLGDSITLGWTQQDWVSQSNLALEPGYRGPLWQEFVNNGMLVNLVGPNQEGPASLPDTGNAGYPGDTTAELLERLPGILAQGTVGAVLLMAGANDVLQGVPQATTIANLTSMLKMIAAADPAAQIYVATLTPLTAGSVTAVNAAITSMVSQENSAGLKVSLVSMSNITTSDLGTDGTHPTATGYGLIAQNWYNAITAQQPNQAGTPGGQATTVSPSVANIVGGAGPQFLIGNSANNIITAGSGYAVLIGGGGNDTLVAGAGPDQFDILSTAGTVSIIGFNPSSADFLDWHQISGLTSTNNLTAVTMQSAGSTIVKLASFGVKETVILEGYTGNLNNSIFN
jgi:VCBS repeat-containing protein